MRDVLVNQRQSICQLAVMSQKIFSRLGFSSQKYNQIISVQGLRGQGWGVLQFLLINQDSLLRTYRHY